MASAQKAPLLYSSTDLSSITPSVDAAIFADDTCLGPDHYRVCSRFQSEINAEHDLAEELLKMLDAKASEADIVAFLKNERDSAAAANASLSGSAFDYKFFRGRHAQTLLTLRQRGGLESLMQQAWRVTQQPRKTLRHLSPE